MSYMIYYISYIINRISYIIYDIKFQLTKTTTKTNIKAGH